MENMLANGISVSLKNTLRNDEIGISKGKMEVDYMQNWIMNKVDVMRKMENAILGELETLLTDDGIMSANYWIDNTHNIFATIADSGDDKWLDIRLELYDCTEEWVGDLYTYDTDDMSMASLERTVEAIVKDYYGE